MRLLCSGILLLAALCPAAAQVGVFYNFIEWAQKTSPERVGYIAGAVDSMVIYAETPDQKSYSVHISGCLRNSGIRTSQLADNVLNYGNQHPEVQSQPVQVALAQYLNVYCSSTHL